ncbi:MAG TPA: LuxR C-terminal-related transcriptional regulator [Spirochaetia bacterium]
MGSLPWTKINDFLLEIGSARTRQDLLRRAVEGIGRLIPYDSSAGIFTPDRELLYGDALSEPVLSAYNSHYRHIQEPFCLTCGPAFPDPRFFSLRMFEYGEYHNSEFYTDFAHPNGLEHAITAPAPNQKVIVSPNRSRRGPRFSDGDVTILELITAHLNNFYSILCKLDDCAATFPTREELVERFPKLSPREAEISYLLCRRLTAPEIASRLLLSVRTVEAHLAHLYAKLNVRSRRSAVSLMTGNEGN